MGAWGIKALESDSGLDVIDFLEDYYNGKKDLILSEIIEQFIKEDFLSEDENNTDFIYDNSAISLAELIVMFCKNGEIDYDNEDDNISLKNKNTFDIDKSSLELIIKYLSDINDEKPSEDGIREYVELWRDSDYYEKWKQHLENLILDLTNILKVK